MSTRADQQPVDDRFVEIDTTPGAWVIDRGFRGRDAPRVLALVLFMATAVPFSIGLMDMALGLTGMRAWELAARTLLVGAAIAFLVRCLLRDRWTREHFAGRPAVQAALDDVIADYALTEHDAIRGSIGMPPGAYEALRVAEVRRDAVFHAVAAAGAEMRVTARAARRAPLMDATLAQGIRRRAGLADLADVADATVSADEHRPYAA